MVMKESLGCLTIKDSSILKEETRTHYKNFHDPKTGEYKGTAERTHDNNIPIRFPFNVIFKKGKVSNLTIDTPNGIINRGKRTISTNFGDIVQTSDYRNGETTNRTKFVQNKHQKNQAKNALKDIGYAAGGIAIYKNSDRIQRSINRLQNKLNYYQDKKHYGPIIAKIKLMIRKLQDKL